MPPIVTKTPNQMDEVADILEDDELLVSRGGVIGTSKVAAVRTALGERLAAEFAGEDLGVALAAAQISTDNAAATAADAALAGEAADRAVLAAASQGSYPNSAATVVPRGVTGVAITNAGSGYTDGLDYVGTFTGGGGAGARFLFDVAGGAVTNIHGIEPGYGYTSNPTPVFTAAPAGSGATGTATASHLVLSGQFYFAASADAATERMYQNVAGVATAVVPAVYRPYAGKVPTTAAAVTSIIWNVTPETGFAVTGVRQVFRAIAPGNNGAGQLRLATPGLFSGAQTPVILPTGEPVPQGALKANYPFEFTPAVIGGTNYLILTFPTVLPAAQSVWLEWMGALAYTDGVGAIAAGQTLTGAVSGATAVVTSVPDAEATGTGSPPAWDGSRAGTLYVKTPAAFVAGEDLLVGGVAKAQAGGPVSTAAALKARVASPNQVYPSDLRGPEMLLKTPHAKEIGSWSLKVYANDGVTVIFTDTPARAADDVTTLTAPGLYAAHDTLRMIRNAPGRINLVTPTDATGRVLSVMTSGGLIEKPPVDRPVRVAKETAARFHVAACVLAYDDPADQLNADLHHLVFEDQGDAMSQGELKSAHVWTLNSDYAELAGGGRADFGLMAAPYLGGGIYGNSPSTSEPVARFCLMSEVFKGEGDTFTTGPNAGKRRADHAGPGHGLERLVPGTAAITIEVQNHFTGVWAAETVTNLPLGESRLGRNLRFSGLYDVFRRTQEGVARVGQVRREHVVGHPDIPEGVYVEARYQVGRRMTYSDQSVAIAEGALITGATSGATAVVVVIPDTDVTGTIGAGDRAGEMFVKDASVTAFTPGENLTVGGVTVAKAASAVGEELGIGDAYGHMMIATSVTMVKAAGQPAQQTGFEDPTGETYQTFAAATRLQAWHPRVVVPSAGGSRLVIKETINLNAALEEAACPATPPGDFSWAPDLQWKVQDRLGSGLRKGYNGWAVNGAARSIAGTFTLRSVHRYRIGAPV